MKKVIRLTEKDLTQLIKRVIKESQEMELDGEMNEIWSFSTKKSEQAKQDLINKMDELIEMSDDPNSKILLKSYERVLENAKEYGYLGDVRLGYTSKGDQMIKYTPKLSKM